MKKMAKSAAILSAAILVLGLFWQPPPASAGPQARIGQPLIRPAWWWTPRTLLLGVGDSLTQGTRDATNNAYNTENAYLHKIARQLALVMPVSFAQPFLNEDGNRINPFTIPTNLAVDGEDIFSVEGYEYGQRAGSSWNYLSDEYRCDRLQPYLFADMHDKVLYPINLRARRPVSQVEALIWHLDRNDGPAWVIFWVGNNDAALSTLGLGGKNPEYLPIPFDQVQDKLKPAVRYLLSFGCSQGVLAFDPYTYEHIEHNLTTEDDFRGQFNHLLSRINLNRSKTQFFFLTFPYYPEIGYLMDKEDLNFYLNKWQYFIPEGFSGRVPLLTFISLYALLKSGETSRLDEILATDSLILSDEERSGIEARIDAFNSITQTVSGSNVHVILIGQKLNEVFASGLAVGGKTLTRSWGRGNAFSLDGVHAGHTVHAFIANLVLDEMNKLLTPHAPKYDLADVLAGDPYVDRDGDGWVAGPDYKASGRTKILFLFKDAQEGVPGPAVIDTMAASAVWDLISDALLEEIVDIPLIRTEAQRLEIIPIK